MASRRGQSMHGSMTTSYLSSQYSRNGRTSVSNVKSTKSGRRHKNQLAYVQHPEYGHVTPVSLIDQEEKNDVTKLAEISVLQEYTLNEGPKQLQKEIFNDSSDSDVAGEAQAEEGNSTFGVKHSNIGLGLGQHKTNAMMDKPETKVSIPIKEWTKEELEEPVTIHLTETETFTLLHLPSVRINAKTEELAEEIMRSNEVYQKSKELHKQKDKFSAASAQTFTLSYRDKKVNTECKGYLKRDNMPPPGTEEMSCQVTTWDIHDSYAKDEESDNDGDFMTQLESENKDNKEGNEENGSTENASYAASELDTIMSLESFKAACRVVEEAVIQNDIHAKHLLFRQHRQAVEPKPQPKIPISTDPDFAANEAKFAASQAETKSKSSDAHLSQLWAYACPLTLHMPVTCLCWNLKNTDLLAAGYGHTNFGNTSKGMVLFWSLKNPHYPAKTIQTTCSVTSLDFSREHPHLLSVGLYDGSVFIYDIRENNDKPDLASQHDTGKHSEPVWALQWVDKENSKKQTLTSLSTDGTVKQWSMKKGLVPHDIMTLKRIPNLAQLQNRQMEGLSREASGMGFDSPNNGVQYFVGTEDGLIQKCSTSYNEQTLENYYGHIGAVYKVRCSKANPDAFLSCSADWTCILWSQERPHPVLKLNHGREAAVMDIQWAPKNSTAFAAVTRDGKVEIWDLKHSTLDPLMTTATFKQLTCVSFSPDAPVVLVGGSDGTIDVYRMFGVANRETEELVGVLQELKNNAEAEQKRKEDAAKANEELPPARMDDLIAMLVTPKEMKETGQINAKLASSRKLNDSSSGAHDGPGFDDATSGSVSTPKSRGRRTPKGKRSGRNGLRKKTSGASSRGSGSRRH